MEGEKKGWNGYKQITCKLVEQITLLFNNNEQFLTWKNNFTIKNRIYIYHKGRFIKIKKLRSSLKILIRW